MTPIFSKLTGFALLVASISTLSASDAGHLEEGAQGWVGSQRSTWSLVKNARAGTTADGQNIVAATGAGVNAFWVRQTSMEHYWAYQLGWFIDPAAGNDENVGSTSGTALRTVAELTRRLSIVLQGTNYTFDLLGNIPSTDRMNWTPIFVGPATGTVFNQRGTLVFRGQQTVFRTGTLTAAAQTTTSTQASATDGATVWTTDVGKLLVMTGGAQVGDSCWIAANLGAGAARVSSWVTSAGAVEAAAPALSTYNIVDLTTWACECTFMAPHDSCILTFQDMDMRPPANAAYFLYFGGAVVRPLRARFTPSANVSGIGSTTASWLVRACCLTSSAGTAAAPMQMQMTGTGASGFAITSGSLVLNYQIEVLTGAAYRATDTLHQGTRVQVANSGTATVFGGYSSFSGNCGFFDWDRNGAALGRDAAISVEGNGFVGISGFVFGTSAVASTYGVRVAAGGQMMITRLTSTGPVAAITVAGAAAAIRFDDPGVGAAVGTAIPPLVAGAVTPAVQPLTTWANFNAAPFGGYVMSYRNGARIYING